MSLNTVKKFQAEIWDYYRSSGRALPWRQNLDPYAIVVSEMMLQQTQVVRVIPKFQDFLEAFPNFAALAAASPAAVLRAWQGLGYNRRGLFLHKLAQEIVTAHAGTLPSDIKQLEHLPGIGPASARSIAAFAFNVPVVFIETNIRRVFIHHFFADRGDVRDQELLPLIQQALPKTRAREWYWALMDYGTHLAQTVPNPNRRSRSYVLQSKFEGSRRQLRGQIIRLLSSGVLTSVEIVRQCERPKPAVKEALLLLERENFIEQVGRRWRLKS